jgi:hypothetical protein
MKQSKKQEMSAQEEAQWRKAQQQAQRSGIVLTRTTSSTERNAAELQ